MRRLAPDAEVYSDGLGAFRAVIDLDHAHTVIQAGGGQAGTGADGARWVHEVGRASCSVRVRQSVSIPVVAVSLPTNQRSVCYSLSAHTRQTIAGRRGSPK